MGNYGFQWLIMVISMGNYGFFMDFTKSSYDVNILVMEDHGISWNIMESTMLIWWNIMKYMMGYLLTVVRIYIYIHVHIRRLQYGQLWSTPVNINYA